MVDGRNPRELPKMLHHTPRAAIQAAAQAHKRRADMYAGLALLACCALGAGLLVLRLVIVGGV